MKQELTDQEIDAIPWANTGSFPVNIRALARSVERIVTERASEAQTPRYSPGSIELVSDHQKACIELLQEGDHDAMIRARLALLRLFADKDAEIAAILAASRYSADICTQALDTVREQEAEIAALRQIISDTVAALGSGAGVGVECSLGFLRQIPEEVRETVKALRQDAERYRWLIEGKRSKSIWNHVLYDFEKEGKGSLQEVIDAGIKATTQAVQPTLICPTCKADRLKEDCKGVRSDCGLKVVAQAVQPSAQ